VWHGIASLLKVDLTSVPRPLTRYRNLSAFFSRGLPEPALSVDPNPQVLVSPVSGIFLGGFPIAEERIIPVKGNPHRLDDLLGGRERIEPFLGGEGYTFYLRPRDYHRIHAFSDMTLYACELFPGTLFPVNRLGQKIPGVFSRNERWVLMGEALWGKVAMVWVGALFVGSLRFLDPRLIPHTPTLKDPYQQFRVSFKKGEEIGCFNLGSTVILLLSAHFSPLLSPGSEVRVGEGVLHIV
jgi:phosphatidylserine decarboxylase